MCYNIGFLCSSESYGGLEMNLIRMANWFHEKGHNVVIYLLPGTPIAKMAGELNLAIRYIKKHGKYYDIPRAVRLYKQMKREGSEVIFFRDTRDMSMAAMIKSFSLGKMKVVYHQAMQLGVSKKDLLHTLRFSRLNAWITTLEHLKEEVLRKTAIKPQKVHVLPLGMDVDKFNAQFADDKKKARKMLDLPQKKLLLGVLGRIDPLKGQDFLIKALSRIRKKNLDAGLVIMGEKTKNKGDEYLQLLNELINRFQLADHVYFRPFSKATMPFFKAVDVFSLASKKETFGMVTVEALVAGVPVIGTNSGGTPEILRYGDYGSLYEPGDLQGYEKKILLMLHDLDAAKQRAEKARVHALKKYSHHHIVEKMEKIFDSFFVN
jgi:glycosyltransferase involved in cell wall biosynthesis